MAWEALTPEQSEALARLSGETARAYAAFLDYVKLGDGRSLRRLLEQYQAWHGEKRGQSEGKARAVSVPTARLATLEGWSTRYRWQERLAAYQAELARREQAVWEQRRAEVRERDWAAGEELRDLAAQVLAQAPQFVKTTRRLLRGRDGAPDREVITLGLDADALLKTLKLASELQRQAAEVPPPRQQHDVRVTQAVPIAFVRVTGVSGSDVGDAGNGPDANAD